MSQEVYYWYDSSNLTLHLSNTQLNKNYEILYFGESYDSYKHAERAVIEGDKLILPENSKYLFFDCNKLSQIDVAKMDVSGVKNASLMFGTCGVTYLDLSMWDVSNIENMSGMFGHAQYMKYLNISNWNMNNVKTVETMFATCWELTSIKVSKDTDWNMLPNLENSKNLFNDCRKIHNWDGTLDVSKAYTGKDGKGYFISEDSSAYIYRDYNWY